MCDGTGDIEDINPLSQYSTKNTSKKFVEKCKKCDEKPVLLLQKKDPFCKSCFFEYCNHKFRSTIGKTKKIKHGNKVLLACSGGRKSTAMLHMTKQALDSASAKQISFSPYVLFIDENVLSSFVKDGEISYSEEVLKNLKQYGYPIVVSYLEMVCKLKNKAELYWIFDPSDNTKAPLQNTEAQTHFRHCLQDMSLSEKCDLIKHMKLMLITEIADQLGFDYVFVGDSGNSLAVDLLSDISLGRGSQISLDTSFCDTRFKVPICRPIREFLNKEILLYNHLHNCSYNVVPDILIQTEPTSCVQRLTESFINDLQENFPATVFTIFRTGGKLSIDSSVLTNKTCLICKSKLDNQNSDPCSAIEAFKISKLLSAPSSNLPEINDISITETSDFISRNVLNSLCHGCSTPFRNQILNKDNFILSQTTINEAISSNSTTIDRNDGLP